MQEQVEHIPLIPHQQHSYSKPKSSYANIEMNRSSMKKRYASPRTNASSYGIGTFHQQNMSFGEKPSNSARQAPSNMPFSTRNTNSFNKLVHMRPAQDYENLSSTPQHQSSMGP